MGTSSSNSSNSKTYYRHPNGQIKGGQGPRGLGQGQIKRLGQLERQRQIERARLQRLRDMEGGYVSGQNSSGYISPDDLRANFVG